MGVPGVAKGSKTQARLVKEGLWDAARELYEAKKQEGIEKGLILAVATREAWEAVDEAYPPAGSLRDVRQNPGIRQSGRFVSPPDWGELPATARYEDEVEWVYQNYLLVTVVDKRGTRILLDRAKSAAPSHGAIGMLEWAIDNRTAFFKDVVPRAKRGADGGEEAKARLERSSVEEIREMLDQLKEKVAMGDVATEPLDQ